MKKGIFAKLNGRSFRGILYRAVCILFALTAISSWAVSGVYAKYIGSNSVDATAGVARMGVVTFELLERKVKDVSTELDKIIGTDEDPGLDMLYEFTDEYVKPGEGNKYEKVIPGTDIPKDPFINLELKNNEVSYELLLEVTETGFILEPTYDGKDGTYRLIDYKLTDDWELVGEKVQNGTSLYRYVGNAEGVVNGVFLAGTPHKYSKEADSAIQILVGDKITVSQYFNSEPVDKTTGKVKRVEFSLKFTAYLQQVIGIPPVTTPEDGAGDSTESGD